MTLLNTATTIGVWYSVLATETNNIQYVTNITTGIQYKWIGDAWVKSYQGAYPGGTWRIVL
jgi:hypothetical protein